MQPTPSPEELRKAEQAWEEVSSTEPTDPSPPARGFLRRFLAENWLWIAVPALLAILLVVAAFVLIALLSDDKTSPFVYAQ